MAGLINDRELVVLARLNETPALQVSVVQKCAASFLLHLRKENSRHNEKSLLPQNSPRMFSPARIYSTYYSVPVLKPVLPPPPRTSDSLVLFSAVLSWYILHGIDDSYCRGLCFQCLVASCTILISLPSMESGATCPLIVTPSRAFIISSSFWFFYCCFMILTARSAVFKA